LSRTEGVELDGIYICESGVSTAAAATSRYVVERQLRLTQSTPRLRIVSTNRDLHLPVATAKISLVCYF